MFELLWIISMALCRSFSLQFMWESSSFSLTQPRGGFHVTSQDRYFLFYTVIVLGQQTKKAQKLSQYEEGLLCEVFTMRRLKRYFNRRSTKAAVAGSSRGHISAARTDPSTPDPPDKQHFLSQALFALVWRLFFVHT